MKILTQSYALKYECEVMAVDTPTMVIQALYTLSYGTAF